MLVVAFIATSAATPPLISAQAPISILKSIENEVVSLVNAVEPSVVSLVTQSTVTLPNGRTVLEHNVGSGIVVHVDGYILTTLDVVRDAGLIQVSFPDGQRRRASIVGEDQLSGIAVVRVDSVTVHPARLGDSDQVSPGSWAIMMGHSDGVPMSVSIGLVNGMRAEDGMLQVNAMASSNTAGGAVFDADARVIGLIAAKVTHAPERQLMDSIDGTPTVGGLGEMIHSDGTVLVLPINQIRLFTEQLIKYGMVRRSWFGVDVEQSWYSIDMGPNLVEVVESRRGLLITRIHSGSPAEKAGLRVGDQITAVNDVPMSHYIRLAEYVTSFPAGADVEIHYVRDAAAAVAVATLEQRPIDMIPARQVRDSIGKRAGILAQDQGGGLMGDRTIRWLMDLDDRLRAFERQLKADRTRSEASSVARP